MGAQRAAEEGLTNVTFEQADAQVEPFADGRFDVVISRFGVMFFSDPVAAFANLARATRPGGRLALVVWQPFAGNEWVEVPRALWPSGATSHRSRKTSRVPSGSPTPIGSIGSSATRAGPTCVLGDVSVPYDYGVEPATAARHASEIGVFRVLLEGLDDVTHRAGDGRAHRRDGGTRARAGRVELDSRIWVVSAVR